MLTVCTLLHIKFKQKCFYPFWKDSGLFLSISVLKITVCYNQKQMHTFPSLLSMFIYWDVFTSVVFPKVGGLSSSLSVLVWHQCKSIWMFFFPQWAPPKCRSASISGPQLRPVAGKTGAFTCRALAPHEKDHPSSPTQNTLGTRFSSLPSSSASTTAAPTTSSHTW